jgi:predicted DNA-binding transcriptional regulator AlpA
VTASVNDQLTDPFIIRSKAAKYLGGVTPSTLYRWVACGTLPPPIRISRKVQGWRRSTLDALLARLAGGAQA